MSCTFAEFCCNCSGTNCISTDKMTYCAVFSQGTPDHAKHITDLTCQGLCKKNCLFSCIFVYLFVYLFICISVLWIVTVQFFR